MQIKRFIRAQGPGLGSRHAARRAEEPARCTVAASACRSRPRLSRPGARAPSRRCPVPTPGACTILNLTLGPINLNLLGLRVATDEIRLLVEAVPGAGNLLGNLLCAITNLLNPSANAPLSQLVQVLNALLALAPRNAAAA